jgi:uncharacterized damage-inducible protein DinB
MTAKDVLRRTIDLSDMMMSRYLGDLSDSDILIRPVPGTNHIAWQLGHLISTERQFIEMIRPGSSPALPDGFDAAHASEMAKEGDDSQFLPLARYQELAKAQREATLAVLDTLSDGDLDRAEPTFPAFAPSVGAILGLIGSHPIMHGGQFVAVRRLAGKPIVI